MIERRPSTLPALQHGDHHRLLRFGRARLGGPARSLAGPLAGGRGPARSRAGLALGPRPGLEIDADRFESFQGSQPLRSLPRRFRGWEKSRHSRGLRYLNVRGAKVVAVRL